ncbi:SERINE/THREONINE-PROTEIN KINASE BLUS1 [Salix koriyanagi]|uniref:SERINE/THREONINE-PROTEIN KINASE BLUS1 n=1 Tax=Salix koriyanagi TaxID=2511006 RepID=A0A9Q0ZLV7_9ROSI|nr:SERINE/THREONINE-PROTEIN KINASE BLUS1 [Salix koriyanagi]
MSASSSSSRADELVQIQYPTGTDAYMNLEQIGGGARATVHKATCVNNDIGFSGLVAIKIIDLEQYTAADLDGLRRETAAMSLHSHPNVLGSHCSFTVDHHLWLVMPYMAAGSLQSIVSSFFPDGMPEPCIAIVLKETLKGLSYLHGLGHLHTDIKAGNILVNHTDNGSSIKLEDSGMSGPQYWIAPEVIQDSNTGYSFKSDIWSFGVTALELAHGGPPFSYLPPSKSLMLKMKKRFGISDYDYDEKSEKDFKNSQFSQAFKDMVASCLDQDPSRRPSADHLLEYSFFKNCEGLDLLFNEFFRGLPNVEERFKEPEALNDGTSIQITSGTDTDSAGSSVKTTMINGWKFNESKFELEPEFHAESKDDAVKTVRFGGDMEGLVGDHSGLNMRGIEGAAETFNQERALLESLVELKGTFDDQKMRVEGMIAQLRRGG